MNQVTKTPEKNSPAALKIELTRMETEFGNALPAHIPVERFMRVVMTAVQNNPKLLECNRRSLWNGAMRAAQDGLLPDGREGAIVDYKGQAQWMPMIGGIRKKVRNSGDIETWDVQAVFENDEFEFELGDDPFIRHKPKLGDRGKIIGVYSVATLKGGEKSRDVMGIDEVEKIRAISRAKNGPWANPTFYPEMAKKTVARRHSKVLPMSSDLDDLIRRDDHLYDLEASSDASVKPKGRMNTGDRLASLAGEDVPEREDSQIEDAEIVDEKPEDGGGNNSGQSAEAQDNPPSVDDDEAVSDEAAQDAYNRGKRARERGQKQSACPAECRKNDRLFASWNDGWADADEAAKGDEK